VRGKHNLHARNADKWDIGPAKVKDECSHRVVFRDRDDRV
jgi:hypothetical protein